MLGRGKSGYFPESFLGYLAFLRSVLVHLPPSSPPLLPGRVPVPVLPYVYYGTDTQNVAAFVKRAAIAYYTHQNSGDLANFWLCGINLKKSNNVSERLSFLFWPGQGENTAT